MEDILVPLGLFAIAPLIVWAVVAYRHKSKKAAFKLLELMTEKGETITPATIQSLGIRTRSPNADLRTGVILITLGLACALLGVFVDEGEMNWPLVGIAMFPFLLGIAYVGLWVFIGRKEPKNLG